MWMPFTVWPKRDLYQVQVPLPVLSVFRRRRFSCGGFSCLPFCAYMYRQAYAKQGFCGRVIASCHIVLFDMKNFSSIICAIWIFTNGQVCSIIEEHPKNGPKPSFIPPAQLSLFIAKYQPYDTLMQEQSRMCCFFLLSVIGYRLSGDVDECLENYSGTFRFGFIALR